MTDRILETMYDCHMGPHVNDESNIPVVIVEYLARGHGALLES